MAQALIGLGSNLGDRRVNLQAAFDALAASDDIHLLAASSHHDTQPIGGPPGQEPFLNAAALLETSLPPQALLQRLLQIEDELGRKRDERWSARTLDLDLLLYNAVVIQTPELIVPHPWMAIRRFVLQPAVEVASDMTHPLVGWSVTRLWEHLNTAPPHFAVVSKSRPRRHRFASQIAQRVDPSNTINPLSLEETISARPKLVFWCDHNEQTEICAALRNVSPWLRLGARDEQEAVAAVQAMR